MAAVCGSCVAGVENLVYKCVPARWASSEMDRFVLHSDALLGEGGFGRTFLGWDKAEGEPVACKCLRVSRLDARARDDVSHELDVLRAIPTHPNVVRLLGAAQRGPDFVIVLEHLGLELFELVAETESGLSEGTARWCFAGLMRAVAHLHEHGVVHRDIKLENVMFVRRDGNGPSHPIPPHPIPSHPIPSSSRMSCSSGGTVTAA